MRKDITYLDENGNFDDTQALECLRWGPKFLGKISVSYSDIVKRFGEPTRKDCYCGTDAEWIVPDLITPRAFIYNFKDGKQFLGETGKIAEDILTWSVGGRDASDLEWLKKELNING